GGAPGGRGGARAAPGGPPPAPRCDAPWSPCTEPGSRRARCPVRRGAAGRTSRHDGRPAGARRRSPRAPDVPGTRPPASRRWRRHRPRWRPPAPPPRGRRPWRGAWFGGGPLRPPSWPARPSGARATVAETPRAASRRQRGAATAPLETRKEPGLRVTPLSRGGTPVEEISFDDIARIKSKISDTFGDWSDPLEVTQDMINRFAELTGDHQWIHVDVERAKRESPFGGTIAHGFLTLSLLPAMRSKAAWKVVGYGNATNYGANKLRFVSPVPAGAKVHSHGRLIGVESH